MEIKGRDMVSGLPRTIKISSDDITEAIQDELDAIITAIKSVLQRTPPELSADIIDKGMVLSGGSSQLTHLAELVSQATDVPAYVADEPHLCVVKGTGIALENLDSYKKSVLAMK